MAASEDANKPQAPAAPPQSTNCTLPYPDRFHVAAKFVELAPKQAKPFPQEIQLLLYALGKQANEGQCTAATPWGWNAVESAKVAAWKQLGNMNKMEAMRLFVRTLDEEQPDWYGLLLQEEEASASTSAGAADATAPAPSAAAASSLEAAAAPSAPSTPSPPADLADIVKPGQWIQVPLASGQKAPLPRYDQGAARVGSSVYVVGGSYAGRYLSDVSSFDLRTLSWSHVVLQPEPAAAAATNGEAEAATANGDSSAPAAAAPAAVTASPLTPLAGHSVTAWGDSLVILGGHVKAKDAAATMTVRVIDTKTKVHRLAPTFGTAPAARGGHTATLIGSKLYIFGGEDASRRALGDLAVLDLASWEWEAVETRGKAPPPRSAHAAAAYLDRFVIIFGGGSIATCYSDVHVLDTATMSWSQPPLVGAKVAPRAGHSGAVLGGSWFVVGGGNNVKGLTDMLALDLSPLAAIPLPQPPTPPAASSSEGGAAPSAPATVATAITTPLTWRSVASIQIRDPLSSEGVSLIPLPDLGGAQGCLFAFGGYNGKYQNATSVFGVPAPQAAEEPAAAGAASEGGAAAASSGGAAGPAAVRAPSAGGDAEDPAAVQPPVTASEFFKAPTPTTPGGSSADAATANGTARASTGGAAAANGKATAPGEDVAALKAALEQARQEAESALREAASAKAGAGHELALLRKQLAGAEASLADAHKATEEARSALSAEQAKVLKLQAEVAELGSKLGAMAELEREVAKLRKMAKEQEEKKGKGMWGYISGA